MTKTSRPEESWAVDGKEELALTIRRRTGLDMHTADEIAEHAVRKGEATFMTATVLLFDGDFAPVSNRRGLSRWRATTVPGEWRLELRARET